MQPVEAAAGWDIPAIESIAALADWLWLKQGQLNRFADLKALRRLGHYWYRVLSKAPGRVRLIESPKRNLKVPGHPAAHGFVRGRSIQTFAAPHVGQRLVLRMDFAGLLSLLSGARIQTVFWTIRYPEAVADLLGGMCTNAVRPEVWSGVQVNWETRSLYARPHLPQGARPRPLWRTSALTVLIAAYWGWPDRREQSTRGALSDSIPTSQLCCGRKGSASIVERHASCVRAYGSIWRDW